MTTSTQNRSSGFFRGALAVITLAALIAFALPQGAQAATSGGATIYNTVKVTYTSGSTTLFASANASVTVNTVGAAPTVTNPAGQIVIAGATPSYNYLIRSNSNGPDTYNTSAHVDAPTNVGAATLPAMTASFTLWGGITVSAGGGFINVPFNTTAGLTAGTSTVYVGALGQYTVTTITGGSAASTDASGNLIAEVPTKLTLTPIGAAPAITAVNAPVGTQVGEYKSAAVTLSLTAGNPTIAGTDGTYASHFTITPVAAPSTPSTTVDVTTTVSSPKVTITKTANPAVNVNPGGTITYTIIVTNTHPTAQVTGVTIIDPVPAYTTYNNGTTRLNGITVAGDGATSPLLTPGLVIDSSLGRAPAALATGIIPAGGVATIVYSVTVQ